MSKGIGLKSAVLAGIVVAVFVAATVAGMLPYTISSASAKSQKANSFSQTDIVSSVSSPTVSILKGASQERSVLQPFSPSVVNVHVGDTVTWTNYDSVQHTVTSAAFDSGAIHPTGNGSKGGTFDHTFSTKGIFSYYCKVHPYMGGTVYVDTEETQRQLTSTLNPSNIDVKVEMPQNAAYQNKYGPFFIPENAIVPAGSRVTWDNHDFIAHTATSSDGGKSFDTGPITPGSSRTVVVQHPGVMAYYCEIHPWMIGTVTVVNKMS